MAGDEVHNEALRQAYPPPAGAEWECAADGWGILTYPDGQKESARCPACGQEDLWRQVQAFLPPRFAETIELPAAVRDWTLRGDEAQGLYLAGQVGTGKTHTAWHTAAAWCMVTGTRPHALHVDGAGNAGPTVIFTRMTDLLDDLRPGDDSRQRVRDCQACKLLVLDDVGAEKASEWTQERLYSIVDHRYANCLPLIVTSNLPPDKLAGQTGARTESRLAEMCLLVPMTGADRRKS
jgi:DNA replication protein DnaC